MFGGLSLGDGGTYLRTPRESWTRSGCVGWELLVFNMVGWHARRPLRFWSACWRKVSSFGPRGMRLSCVGFWRSFAVRRWV